MYRTRVAGTGCYLPERRLTNFDLEKMVETSDQWIRERTGIEERSIAAPGQTTSDLGVQAALRALEDANLKPEDIDMLIFATVTPDQVMPSTACYTADKLGCKAIPAFDLNAACSGFLYAMSVADQFIRSGVHKNILVIGAEILHNFVDYTDRETCILFGDAGGAFILSQTSAADKNIILSAQLSAEGSLSELLTIAGFGSRHPTGPESLTDTNQRYIKMKGREVYKNAVRTMSTCAQQALEANKMSMDEVSWLIPHQANTRIMEAVADHFGFPKERVVNVIKKMGNTSSATIPTAFNMGVKDGRIQRGQNILLAAFGAGLTAGSLVFRY
jgi:3-oxoacyl-[acyl-carrier-protein] synthase-3